MHRNLLAGLLTQSEQTAAEVAKVFPGIAELVILRLVGAVWSTSDWSHPVVAPAMLYMGQVLAQGRVKELRDLVGGVFMCSLVLQYETLSKRLVPEAITFLFNAVLLLAPHSLSPNALPGSFPVQDLLSSPSKSTLYIVHGSTSPPQLLSLVNLMSLSPEDTVETEQAKINLLDAVLSLLGNFSSLYVSLDAFIEVFTPLPAILAAVNASSLPSTLQSRLASTTDAIAKQLRFATQSRRPLRLQAHRPIPIPSLAPAFDDSDPTKRKWDPDSERAEAAKLRALLRKEKKGAIRELRKDNRFLATERAKEKSESDKTYNTKIARITAGIQEERAEEKKQGRTKDRLKKLDKKRSADSGGKSRK